MAKEKIQRPIRPVTFLIIVLGLFENIIESFLLVITQLIEVAIYHSHREHDIEKVWEEFATDLESMEGDTDGNAGLN